MKKCRLLVLLVLVMLMLTACGKGDTQSGAASLSVDYSVQECNVSGIVGNIRNTYFQDDILYSGVYKKGTAVSEGRYTVVTYDTNSKQTETVLLQGKEEMAFWDFTVAEDGGYIGIFIRLNDEGKDIDSIWRCTFARDGEMLREEDLSDTANGIKKDRLDLNCFGLDQKGNFYFTSTTSHNNSLSCVLYEIAESGEGKILKEWDNANISSVSRVRNEVYVVVDNSEKKCALYRIIPGKILEDEQAEIKHDNALSLVNLSEGVNPSEMIVQKNSDVYYFNIETGEEAFLFTLDDVSLEFGNFNMGRFLTNEEDSYYVLKKISVTDDNRGIYDWVEVKKSDVASPKEVFYIAVNEKNTNLLNAVKEYNQSSAEYKAEIKVYSNEDQEITSNLQKEIIAGNIPDMMSTDVVDMDILVKKGILQDLTDYLAKDQEVTTESFVGKALDIYKREDKIYALPSSIGIVSLVGKKEILPDHDQWNVEQICDFLDTLPDKEAGLMGYSKDEMLQIMMELRGHQFIDYDTKTSAFDSEEFAEVLSFVNLYPAQPIQLEADLGKICEMLQDDEMVLYPGTITDIRSYSLNREILGAEPKYIGFPSENGQGIMLADLGTGYVISQESKYKDELWKIIKLMVTDAELMKSGMPAYKPLFEQACEEVLVKEWQENENGVLEEVPVSVLELGNIALTIYAPNEKDITDIKDLISEAQPTTFSSREILAIVREEADGYFAGDKNLEETTQLIKNRVDMYLSE